MAIPKGDPVTVTLAELWIAVHEFSKGLESLRVKVSYPDDSWPSHWRWERLEK